MKFHEHKITNISSILAGIISIIIATSIPSFYFFITYKYIAGSINAELVISAQAVEGFVIRNPKSWQFEEIRLKEILERSIDPAVHDNKIIRDLQGNIIAELGEPLKPPVVVFSEPIYDSGIKVASIEVEHSIAPLYFRTAIIGVFSSLLGIITFLGFYFFRIRVLRDTYTKLQESERKYRLLVEKTSDIVWIADMDLRTIYISPSVTKVLGFTAEELPKTVAEQMTPNSVAVAMETLARELELEKQGHADPDRTLTLVLEYYHKDGSIRWLETIINGLRNDQGVLTGIHGTSRDVTEHKLMEDKINESEENYRQLYENSPAAIYRIDFQSGKFIQANDLTCFYVGCHKKDITSFSPYDILTQESRKLFLERMEKMSRGVEVPDVIEYETVNKQGDRRYLRLNNKFVYNAEGQIIASDVVAHDITERKRAERALEESERKFKLITEKMTDVVWMTDINMKPLYVSPSVKTLLGFSPEEQMQMTLDRQLTPASLAYAIEVNARELAFEEKGNGDPERAITLDLEFYHKDGSTRWTETVITGIRNEQGILTGLHGASRDITDRKKAEKALEESERKYKLIAEKMTDIVWMTDLNMKLLYISPSVKTVLGFSVEEAMQGNILRYLTRDSLAVAINTNVRELTMEARGQGDPDRTVSLVLEYTHRDGSTRWMETVISGIRNEKGLLTAIHGLSRDITGRKRAEDALAKSEEKYRTIIESIEDGYAEIDLKGNFLFVNGALCEIDGYSRDELMKLNYRDIMDEENAHKVYAEYHKAYVTGESQNDFEYEIITKDGIKKYLETSVKPIKDADNHVIAFRGIVRDRTHRKLADEKLRKSQELYTRLVNTIPDIIIHTTIDGNIIFINEYALKMSGYTREEIEGHNLFEFISSENREEGIKNLQSRVEQKLGPREYNLIIKGGIEIPFEVNTDFLRNEDGTPFGIVSVCRDISERRRTERLLMDKEERLRGITENLPGVIFQFYVKDNGEQGLNYISEPLDEFSKIMTNEETENLEAAFPSFVSRIYEKDRGRFLASIQTAIEKFIPWNFEGRIMRFGKVIWFQGLSTPTRLEDQTIFNGILLNITERKLAEESSLKSEEKFYKIFMTSPDMIGIIRLEDGALMDVNQGAWDIVGWDRDVVIGKNITEPPLSFWVDLSAYDQMVADLKAGINVLYREFEFRRADGSIRAGIYSARPINIKGEACLIFIMRDITEQKQMEKELVESQKMKLMGQITSGVAHEVRNPLHAIQAISEAMALDMDEKIDHKEYLMHIRSQVSRLSHLMSDLLELGKPIQPSQFSPAFLTEITDSAVRNWKDAHPQLSHRIKVEDNLQNKDMVLADTNKIQQVIINLLENASQQSPKDEEILLTLNKSDKNYLLVEVIDNGTGLKPQDQTKVFEPFYTTRKSGTGLGLSLCKHIIESHGGTIELSNNKNAQGCTAWFAIPIYHKQGA